MQTLKARDHCPYCGEEVVMNVPADPALLAPAVRGKLRPAGTIQVYKISSQDITAFLTEKSRLFCPDVKVETVSLYCERKARSEREPHRSYASMRVGFSEHIIEEAKSDGWFGRVGEINGTSRIKKTMFENIIRRYSYNRKEVESWLKSYKRMEDLEENLGMTEPFITDILKYCTPQRVRTTDKEDWIIFSLAPENVISDMLTPIDEGEKPGRIQIADIYQINKDNVEYVVYVHPAEMKLKENPHVRQILLGEDKKKK